MLQRAGRTGPLCYDRFCFFLDWRVFPPLQSVCVTALTVPARISGSDATSCQACRRYRQIASMNCDFHCHSTCSDGLLPPADVVRRAHANGVTWLALTDHDELAGIPEAQATAEELGVRFAPGVEISIEWADTPIHMVGLAVDPTSADLVAGLTAIRNGREDRARRMAAELERIGIRGTFEGAMGYCENPSLISRAHFARYLVQIGIAKDVKSVFDDYLVPGKPGYVPHRWVTLEEAVAWVHGAGGLAVVAHPGRYKLSNKHLGFFFEAFKDCGGDAIEVVSGSHGPDEVAKFAHVARKFGFLASRGSDFHGPGESYSDLGRIASLPDGLTPVWEKM